MQFNRLPLTLAAALAFTACSSGADNPASPGTPGSQVQVPRSASQDAAYQRIESELTSTQNLSTAELLQIYDTEQAAQIEYDPMTAQRLDLIQNSQVALTASEQTTLGSNGFVISEAKHFPSFMYGYETIYMQDLPVFVSADSIMHAVHSSYDEILKTLEVAALVPELDILLTSMRASLVAGGASGLGTQAEADADMYLTVALSLLRDSQEAPVAGANPSDVADLIARADAADGRQKIEFFGVSRDMDFSQFEPRGHYTESPTLEQYFRAMMWLGRIDLRLIETQPDHSQVFHRRQFEGALALYSLMDSAAMTRWSKIDGTIEAFVGEADNMTLNHLESLLADLGTKDPTALARKTDAELSEAILQGGYGTQRISSHIMINGLGERTMPLSSTFLLLGQRYVVDSHVFSNVVYDRVQRGEVRRMMPDPLDVAFAALGNSQAASLLTTELNQYNYAPDLHAMRFLVDEHGDEFWGKNLYNRWLSSLRALSPGEEAKSPSQHGLPGLMGTEAWGRRLLNTQLASWAELRHDTILYAKQSYTGGVSCEFPDAYVEPYPEFYAGVEALAQHGRQVVQNLDLGVQPQVIDGIVAYFTELETHIATLRTMAEQQRAGSAFSDEQLAFINDAVVVHNGCGSPVDAEGWFSRLYYNRAKGAQWDPTVADIHTQPTDAAGNDVGRVLHVGTGGPRLMVVTIETCDGVNAYAGLVSSYFEHTTEQYDRLTDERWQQQISQQRPADPTWLQGLIVR